MTLRYRRLDADGDMVFGHGSADFLVDIPDAVAQSIGTRLKLFTGEWFVDLTVGMPWLTQVVGDHTLPLADGAITNRIVGTFGVLSLLEYDSEYDPTVRLFTVHATVNTIFGLTDVDVSFPIYPNIFTLNESPLDGDDPLG